MSTDATVHVGFWTNWSKGSVSGSTLTLTNRNGAVLIAALAIIIQLSGGRSWTILCFIFHQFRATRQSRDGLYHQQQATLRNSSSDVNSMWQFTKIGWAWRRHSSRSLLKSTTLVTTAVLHLLAFAAAGILASHITTVGDQVLLAQSPYCGSWDIKDPGGIVNASSLGHATAYISYHRMATQSSNQYVQNCLTESQSLPECNVFARARLNWTSAGASCPFNGLCVGPSAGALYMDTGLLNSRDDLGVNAQDQHTILWRKNATCAPITTQGYTASGNSSFSQSQEQNLEGTSFKDVPVYLPFNYTAAFYGASPYVNNSDWGLSDPSLQNATYIYTNFRDIATPIYNQQVGPYDIHPISSDIGNSFRPIKALQSPNSTLTLIFASYYGVYYNESNDQWLSAHHSIPTQQVEESGVGEVINQYSFDAPISVLACQEQLQFCKLAKGSSNQTCSPFMSIRDTKDGIKNGLLETIFNTQRQIETAKAIGDAAIYSAFLYVVGNLESPLLAQSLSTNGLSLPPASNQWTLEANNWFTVSLASTQRLLVDYITGPPSQFAQFTSQHQAEDDSTLEWLCSNQIVQRNDFTNFSTLAICLIFGLGFILVLSSFWTETVVGCTRVRSKRGLWRQRAWWSEETLQLQMKAFIGMGVTDWKFEAIDRVPVNRARRVWSSVREWDEMRSQVDECSGEESKKRDEIWSTKEKKDGVVVKISPGSSGDSGDLEYAKRSRSNSV